MPTQNPPPCQPSELSYASIVKKPRTQASSTSSDTGLPDSPTPRTVVRPLLSTAPHANFTAAMATAAATTGAATPGSVRAATQDVTDKAVEAKPARLLPAPTLKLTTLVTVKTASGKARLVAMSPKRIARAKGAARAPETANAPQPGSNSKVNDGQARPQTKDSTPHREVEPPEGQGREPGRMPEEDAMGPRGTKRLRSPTTPASSPKQPPSLNDVWTEHMSMSSGLAEFADHKFYEPGTTLGFVLNDYERYKRSIGRPSTRPADENTDAITRPVPDALGAQLPRAPEPGSTEGAAVHNAPRGADRHHSSSAHGQQARGPNSRDKSPARPRSPSMREDEHDENMEVDPPTPPADNVTPLQEATVAALEENDEQQERRRAAIIRAWLADQARLTAQLHEERRRVEGQDQGRPESEDDEDGGWIRVNDPKKKHTRDRRADPKDRGVRQNNPPVGYVLPSSRGPGGPDPGTQTSRSPRIAYREGSALLSKQAGHESPAPTPAGKLWAANAARALGNDAADHEHGSQEEGARDVLVSEERGFEELLNDQANGHLGAPMDARAAGAGRRSPTAGPPPTPAGQQARTLPPFQETKPWSNTYWTAIGRHIPIERDDPLAMLFGMDRERVAKWMGYNRRTTLLIEPYNSALPNKERVDAMTLLIADVLREVAGLPDTPNVLAPKLAKPQLEETGRRNHPRATGDRFPTVWCAKDLPEDKVQFLLGDRARSPYFSTPKLTFRALGLTQRFPTFLFALGGHGRTVLAEVGETVKAAFFSEAFYNVTAPYLTEAAELHGREVGDEVLRVANTCRVAVFRLPGSGAIIANVYCLSPTSDIRQWREWRRAVSTINFGDDDEGRKPYVRPPVLCGGCQAADHSSSQCPFPDIPGWNRPRPPPKRKEGKPPAAGASGRGRERAERAHGHGAYSGQYDGVNQRAAAGGPSNHYQAQRDWSGARPQTRGRERRDHGQGYGLAEGGASMHDGEESGFTYDGF
ncbi:hypothetical protein C8Q76DRAFT_791211 [Earliella scabrosa]|nr:hypothetical protein C8Q76DRAFT_791211 [Earliella scabrosa]